MSEVLFYHLRRRPLEDVLRELLEKSLQRGWNAVVQCAGPERVEALDAYLWTYRDDSFLPHGAGPDMAAAQPVYLTTADDNPNAAQIRFMVDGAAPPALDGYERAVFLFDDADEAARAEARERWREARAAGHEVTYWLETEAGSFAKKA